MKKRGELTWDTLIPWILAVGVLVIIVILYFALRGSGVNMLTYVKNLLRFGKA